MPAPLRPRVPLSPDSGRRPPIGVGAAQPGKTASPPQPGKLGGAPSTFGGQGSVGAGVGSAIGNIGNRMAAAGVRAQYGQMQNAAGANVIQPGRGPNAAGAPPIQQRGAAGAPGPGAPGQWERDQGSMGRGAYRGSHEGAWEQSRVTLPSEMRGPTLDPKDAPLMGKGAGVGVPGTPRGLQNPLNKTFPAGDPNAPPGAPSAPRASITGLQTPYQATPISTATAQTPLRTPLPTSGAEQQTFDKQGATGQTAASQIESQASGLTGNDPRDKGRGVVDGQVNPLSGFYETAAGQTWEPVGESANGRKLYRDPETEIDYEVSEDGSYAVPYTNTAGYDPYTGETYKSPGDEIPRAPGEQYQNDAGETVVRDVNGSGHVVTSIDGNGNSVTADGYVIDKEGRIISGPAGTTPSPGAGTDPQQDRINQLLDSKPPAGMDRAGLDAMKRSNEAQFASEAAKAMRAGLVASARSGMSPEAQSGMIADVGERGGLAAQAANAQAELQFAAQQAQQNLAYYQQQQEALKFAISLAQDDETRAALMRQQMLMAQFEKQANMDLMKYQAELTKPQWYDYLLGGLGSLVGAGGSVVGGLASGGYLGKP